MIKWISNGFALVVIIGLLSSCQKPQGLQFTGFRNFQIEPISFASSKIKCEVGVYNPNTFSISVRHLDANLQLSGKSLGDYSLDSNIVLPATSPFYLPIQLEVRNASLVSNSLAVMLGDSLPYSVTGKVKAGHKKIMTEIPFSYSGHLTSKDFNF